jgi:hypothetical protein
MAAAGLCAIRRSSGEGRAREERGGGAPEREAACAWEGTEVAGRPAGEEGRPPAEEPRKKESDGGGRDE